MFLVRFFAGTPSDDSLRLVNLTREDSMIVEF